MLKQEDCHEFQVYLSYKVRPSVLINKPASKSINQSRPVTGPGNSWQTLVGPQSRFSSNKWSQRLKERPGGWQVSFS